MMSSGNTSQDQAQAIATRQALLVAATPSQGQSDAQAFAAAMWSSALTVTISGR